VHKTVTVTAGTPTSSLVDVYFLADTTGSMGGVIGAVSAAATAILTSTAGLGDVKFAVGEYKDQPSTDPTSAYAYHLNTAMTSSVAAATAGINLWSAGGGGDTPEAQLFGLQTLATNPATGWRTGSAKILVWMGDAPGHDPSGGATLASAIAALTSGQSSVIKTFAMDVGALNSTSQATAITTATGGAVFAGLNSASVVAAITAAITSAFSTYSSVSLDLSEAPGTHVSVVSTPAITGSFDRSISRTFGFDVTFTGLSEGTDDFNIYAKVDTGRVATEGDGITVSASSPSSPSFLVRYGANPAAGESYVNIVNTGANGAPLLGPGFGGAAGNVCVNVYAFSPDEQLISCCSCLITPNGVVNLGVNRDLTIKTLTGVVPSSVTVKLVSTLAGAGGTGGATVCNNSAATVTTATIVGGMAAWGTTLHAAPGGFATTETPFTPATLSAGELASIGGRCASILGNGSGFGVCLSCRAGGLGAAKM
jgi:hypothetical protein